MILDLLQTIVDACNLTTQLQLNRIDNHTYNNIYIYSIRKCPYAMYNKILKKRIFSRLKILNCKHNEYITDLNHLADTLEELNCSTRRCNIRQESIKELKKLRILNCSNNINVNNFNHFADTLEELNCTGCYIYDWFPKDRLAGQSEISKLKKLKILKCHHVEGIVDVNHLADTLEELDCSEYCGINQQGISLLKKIKKLNCYGNVNINNLDHMAKTLEILECDGCGIGQKEIQNLNKLRVLKCGGNICDVNHLIADLPTVSDRKVSQI